MTILLVLLILLACAIHFVSSQILVDIDDSRPNLVISDMNHDNYTMAVSIPYDSSATSIAIDICLHIEQNRNESFDNLFSCIDDVGRKVIFGRITSNHSKTLIYNDISKNDNNDIKIEIEIDNTGTTLIHNRNQRAIDKGISIAPINDNMCTSRHININQEILATNLYHENPITSRYNGIGAIVILAQAGQHSTYVNFNALNELKKTLELLYKNYNNDQKDDIWIFHEGDFTTKIQNEVRANRSEIRFFHLKDENWSVYPPFVENRWSSRSKLPYSLGYRLMIRWYAIRIWHVMAMMGYTWILRLDDDSGILSPIKFNIFGFMEKYGYQYAYRIVAVESPHSLFYDFLTSHIIKHKITNISQMMDVCETKETLADFNFPNCGLTPGYYTNFFVTNVTRWLDPDVQSLLHSFDNTGMMFLARWGDLEIQSAIVRILFPENQIHRFTSFSYSHFSGNQRLAIYGIIQTGVFDEDQEAIIRNFADFNDWEDKNITISNLTMSHGMLTYSKNFCFAPKANESCLC